jgi:purine-nucleoside phosphorylase
MLKQINEATTFIQKRLVHPPEVAVILGTGLGNLFVESIRNPVVINYNAIPHFPISTVATHKGQLVAGELHGKQVITMRGRLHYYEGYTMHQIALPIRVMKTLGVSTLLISNAAGNLNPKWRKGELMLLDDHLNLQPDNPLRGENYEVFGPRFPDMSEPYSRRLNKKVLGIAKRAKIKVHQGVYAAVQGPNLETHAECRFLRMAGADAVGMSTVPEVIVARHAAMECMAISVLTNDAFPEKHGRVELKHIVAAAGKAEKSLVTLFTRLIETL